MAESKCPFNQKPPTPKSVREWWPSQLDLKILRQNAGKSDPMGPDFQYAREFKSLDLAALKRGHRRCDRCRHCAMPYE